MTAILKSKMAVLDLLMLFIFKYHWQVFNCEVKINVLNPKLAKHHLTNNSVDGKHNLLSVNHISSDLEGHQVQYHDIRFGTIS